MIHVEFIEDLRVGDVVIYDDEQNHVGYVNKIVEHYDNNEEIYYTATIVWLDGHRDTVWENHDISNEPLRVLRND